MTFWIGYAKSGKEIEVCKEINDLGLKAHCAIKVEMIRTGKNRKAEPVTTPVLPNYVFIEADVENWFDLIQVKHLASTKTVCPAADIPRVMGFVRRCEAEHRHQSARIEAGEALPTFKQGQTLEIVSGALGGLMARFRGVVENDIDSQFPAIEAEVDLMGQAVITRFDPLDVKAQDC